VDPGCGEAPGSGVENEAGDRNVRAQSDPGQDVDVLDGGRPVFKAAREADTAVALLEVGRGVLGEGKLDDRGEEGGVGVAEGRLEEVGEAFYNDAEEGVAPFARAVLIRMEGAADKGLQ
jgi:hypothetical protein